LLLPEEDEDGVRDLLRGREAEAPVVGACSSAEEEDVGRPAAEVGLEVLPLLFFLLSFLSPPVPEDRPSRTPPPRTPTLPLE